MYDFIEFIGADGQMFSSSGTVNVNDYKDPDGNWNAEALDIIRTYYSDLDELRNSVSNLADEDQLVAECIFEQTSSYDSDSLTMSEDAAYTYLDDVISGRVMASTRSSTIKASSNVKYPVVTLSSEGENITGRLDSGEFIQAIVKAMHQNDEFATALANFFDPESNNEIWEDTTYEEVAIGIIDFCKDVS